MLKQVTLCALSYPALSLNRAVQGRTDVMFFIRCKYFFGQKIGPKKTWKPLKALYFYLLICRRLCMLIYLKPTSAAIVNTNKLNRTRWQLKPGCQIFGHHIVMIILHDIMLKLLLFRMHKLDNVFMGITILCYFKAKIVLLKKCVIHIYVF